VKYKGGFEREEMKVLTGVFLVRIKALNQVK